MRLEDGSIVEAHSALSRLMYGYLVASSSQIILPITSLVKEQWPQSLQYTCNRDDSFERPLHELFLWVHFSSQKSMVGDIFLQAPSCPVKSAYRL